MKTGSKRIASGGAAANHLKISNSGQDRGQNIESRARRALMFRRLWLFLLSAALVLIGLASVVRARFF
ncbi:MAG: hypothetical protein IJT68_01795 [Lentisphaeria bacterium]|nr:hypothetical protein [Lentisphaeria bacterium]